MSGALAQALGAVSAVGSALTLLTGGSIVTLDSIAFMDFGIPESVRWGGTQQLAVHRFPGGARVVDAMGPEWTTRSVGIIYKARVALNVNFCFRTLNRAGLFLA